MLLRIVMVICWLACSGCSSRTLIHESSNSAGPNNEWLQRIHVGDTIEVTLKSDAEPNAFVITEITDKTISGKNSGPITIPIDDIKTVKIIRFNLAKTTFATLGSTLLVLGLAILTFISSF